MKIIQLSECCCGCSLKTGTKIIGWTSLVGYAIMLVATCASLAGLYYIEDHPKPETEKIRPHLPALETLTIFMIIVHIVGCGIAFMLLLGVYQNKAKFVLWWVLIALTSACVEQALNLVEVVFFGRIERLAGTLEFVLDLYFILVVYSYYREIENVSGHV